MPEKNKEDLILEIFKKVIPNLSERGQDKLLSFGEGMLLMIQDRAVTANTKPVQ